MELTTSMVTNGSRITPEWLDGVEGCLDWTAVSIDTVDQRKMKLMGRTTRTGPLSETDYLGTMEMLRQRGIRLKINTVVTRSNCDEDLDEFHRQSSPRTLEIASGAPGQWPE